jgi:probable F420-dependent oxidoreductase
LSIRVGVQLHPQHTTYDDLASAAEQVDALGFDTLFAWDHFFALYGSPGAPFGEVIPTGARPGELLDAHFEGWTLLTALACVTRRVEVGLLVTCNSYRNPNLLADMARTVDHVSHGRLILGIGSGWFERDYVEYGYDFGTAASRLRDLRESLPIIEDRLARLHPPPVRNPIPILIGGGGEKVTLKLVAKHANIWNFACAPQEFKRKMTILDEYCAQIGRDPAEIERSILIQQPSDLAWLDAWYEVGIRHFIYGLGIPFDLTPARRLLEWRERRAR